MGDPEDRQAILDGVERFRDTWPQALELWSTFIRLRDPILCTSTTGARDEGLRDSFAMIRLDDQTVVINLEMLHRLDLLDRPLEVLGHEIGHHVVAPASLLRSGQVIARMRVALPSVEQHAPMLANMWADLLINDQLTRNHGLDLAHLYAALNAANPGDMSGLWLMYLRTYEILWGLQRGTLAPVKAGGRGTVEGDAQLGARLLRSYAGQWVDGAGRFAALCLPYLIAKGQDDAMADARIWGDALTPGRGGDVPIGLTAIDDDELDGAIHPAADPALSGLTPLGDDEVDASGEGTGPPVSGSPQSGARGQRREPFEYGEILRAMGMDLTDHEIAVRWYREQAMPHLIPFPSRAHHLPGETLPEGYAPWEPGEALEDIDWMQSILNSPVVFPGITTVQRVYGVDDVAPPVEVPLHLDIYVDSSGSMPNPQRSVSYPALAATVLILSALRSGAQVQATLWSGTSQFHTTDGFTDDRDRLLRVVLGHFGGGTAFPLHLLRDTYLDRDEADPPVHIVVISDSGVSTINQVDEQGTPGIEIQQMALASCRGGGTWVLEHARNARLFADRTNRDVDLENPGWDIAHVESQEELVDFARAFARRAYSPTLTGAEVAGG